MAAVISAIDFDTVTLVSHLMDANSAESYLRCQGVGVSVKTFSGSASNACVVLSAHEFTDQQLLDICSSLQQCWVHLVSAGTEYVGLPNLSKVNLLTRSWQAYGRPLAEYVLAALLEVAWRDGHRWHKLTHSEDGRGLFGRSALLFGFGAIGRNIARALTAMGVRVSVLHQHQRPHPDDGLRHMTLSELTDEYDYFVLALPESLSTQQLVNDKVLSHLKADGHLVNIGRGSTIETAALCRAIETRSIWVTLDVTDPEPLPANHVLRHHARARISDHVAWQSGQSEFCFLDDWLTLRGCLRTDQALPIEAVVNHRFSRSR